MEKNINIYTLEFYASQLELLSEYDILVLLEYATKHNKLAICNSIKDYIIHNCSVQLCQYFDLPNNEIDRYQPSCIRPSLFNYYVKYS